MRDLRRRYRARQKRRGVATVELAICLPVILLLVVGAIEGSNFIYLKQAVTAAAYESVQTVTRVGGTKAKAENRAAEVLSARSIDQSTVSFTPANPDSVARGGQVTVSITAPMSANSIGLRWFFDSESVTASVCMLRN
ncbi:MAG: pilus assembly protein [Gemmataceae bacterium]|nr:pilus assembly protein [Gemmataceae bacterium]